MSPPSLPDPIAAHLAADTRRHDDVARRFTPQAVVKDRGAGTFPGSPTGLEVFFRLERGPVASLEITA